MELIVEREDGAVDGPFIVGQSGDFDELEGRGGGHGVRSGGGTAEGVHSMGFVAVA